MTYETFEEFLDATRNNRPRPKMIDAWLAGRDSTREYYAPILFCPACRTKPKTARQEVQP